MWATQADSFSKDEVLQNTKAAASTPGSSLFPLLPAKTEPEGFEPDPETVDPFLSEEEVCGDALQALEATCVHEQTEAWCLAP